MPVKGPGILRRCGSIHEASWFEKAAGMRRPLLQEVMQELFLLVASCSVIQTYSGILLAEYYTNHSRTRLRVRRIVSLWRCDFRIPQPIHDRAT